MPVRIRAARSAADWPCAAALAAFAACIAFASMPQPAAAASRVALVIGNSAYTVSPLANPVSDARAMAQTLSGLGFSVTTVENATKGQLEAALGAFGASANGSDFAVVYYAGHGTELDGRNYLIPVDAQLARAADLDLQAVSLATVLGQLEGAKRLKLVLLDACRNNVFPLAGGKRSAKRGLARIEPEDNTLIAYAAKDGTTADDGEGAQHSPFATSLMRHLPTPGLEIRFLLAEVRDDVVTMTNREQQPHIYGTLGRDRIYFSDPTSGPDAGGAPPAGGQQIAALPPAPLPPAGPTSSLVVSDLRGIWRGFYNYTGKQKVKPVPFELSVMVDGSNCVGHISEPNSFGDNSSPILAAMVTCKLDVSQSPPRFIFTKIYDGQGGVSHSVEYEGRLDDDTGNSISGRWRIGKDTGPFSMQR